MAKSNKNHKPTILISLLIIGWVAALLIESSQPPLQILSEIKGLDKVAHFLAFTVLGLLVCTLSFKLNPKPAIQIFSMPLLIVTLFGILEESYQMLTPGRASELMDLLADIGGALFAIIVANSVARLIQAIKRISS